MMMNHIHNHMMMHKKHFEKAQQAHMMALGVCCIITIGIGIATVCLFKSKRGIEMRAHIKNRAVDTAEILKDMVENNVEKAKTFVADTKEEVMDPAVEISI